MKNKFPYRYRVQVLLFFLILITYLDRVCISLVGVRLKSEFNLSNEKFGWVLGAFALAYALFEIPAGVLGDRIGQRKVLMRIVLWWSLFTALTGFTVGFITLLCVRFLFGMGEAGAFPNSTGVISRWFPAAETAKGVSSLMIGSSTGAAIAPLIVVPLAVAYGWRVPFFVSGIIGLAWVLVCFLWFRNYPSEMKGITSEEKELIEKNRYYSNHNHTLTWKACFRKSNIWAMMLAFFCSQWSLYFFIAWMPVYLQEGRHFSEADMKLTTSYLFIIGIAGGLLSGVVNDWLVRKRGLKFSRRFMGMLTLGMMSLLFFITATTSSSTIVTICLISCYFFVPAFGINAFSTCIDVGQNNAGTVAGIMNFAGNMGAFSIAIIFGKIVDTTHNFNAPLFVLAGVLLTGGFTWLSVDPTKKISQIKSADKLVMQYQ